MEKQPAVLNSKENGIRIKTQSYLNDNTYQDFLTDHFPGNFGILQVQ